MDNSRGIMLDMFGAIMMNHPFDDFLSQQWHDQKRDRRVFRYGLLLVGLVILTTFSAFTTTMSHWRSVTQSQQSVSARWEDAQQRMYGYVKSERALRRELAQAKTLNSLLDIVPKSILLFEMTSVLPTKAYLLSIRIDSRTRPNDEGVATTMNTIHVVGEAPDDVALSLYVEKLKLSTYFEKVALQYSQKKQGRESRDFAISMEVHNTTRMTQAESSP